MEEKICSLCQESNHCKIGEGVCWCFDYPSLDRLRDLLTGESLEKGCYCQDCFNRELGKFIELFVEGFRKGELPNIAPDLATNSKPIKGIDYYLEDGRWVFTSWSHLKRGYCCGSGCRHCPYPKIKTS